MALTKASLSTKIVNAIEAEYGSADDSATLKKFADAVADAVVDEITNNAVVNPTALLDSMSGAVTGTGTIS